MKSFAITALGLLTLSLGGCMHTGAHSMHHEMESHRSGACPPEQARDPAAAHEHAEGDQSDECPAQSHPQ